MVGYDLIQTRTMAGEDFFLFPEKPLSGKNAGRREVRRAAHVRRRPVRGRFMTKRLGRQSRDDGLEKGEEVKRQVKRGRRYSALFREEKRNTFPLHTKKPYAGLTQIRL